MTKLEQAIRQVSEMREFYKNIKRSDETKKQHDGPRAANAGKKRRVRVKSRRDG